MVDCKDCVALRAVADEETALEEVVDEADDAVVDCVTPRPWRMNEPSPVPEEELDDSEMRDVVSVWASERSVDAEEVVLEVEPEAKPLVVELSVAFASPLQHLRLKHIASRRCHLEPMAVLQNTRSGLIMTKQSRQVHQTDLSANCTNGHMLCNTPQKFQLRLNWPCCHLHVKRTLAEDAHESGRDLRFKIPATVYS